MKTIIGLTIAFVLAVGMICVGTFAYFSDTETSAGNQLTAGTLDLKTDDADGVSETLYATNMAPGDTVGPSTIVLKNSGSVDGSSLDIGFSYVENDGSRNSVDKSANDTAAMMEVTTLSYGGSSLLSSVSDSNGNGYKDIEDLKNEDLSGQSGINASATENFEIAAQLRSETSDDFQADGITLTMTFTLNQCGSSYAWYDTNWQCRRQITIDHTKVENVANPSTTYADFPVLVYATGLSNIKANGADIRFTSSDGTTELPREIESYSGGTLWAWVKVTLTKDAGDSTDDVIYMYYGNDSASEPAPGSAYGAENVWDSNYVMVQHLQEDPTDPDPAFKDSTSNDNDGSNWGSMTASDQVIGQVDGSIDFDGLNDRINLGNIGTLSNNTFSISVWVKVLDPSPRQEMVWGAVTSTSDERFRFEVYDTWINFHDDYNMDTWTSSGTIEADRWYHVVATYDYPGQTASIYLDGEFKASDTSFIQASSTLGALQIGSRDGSYYINGVLDEVRISDIARSAQWIETCYNNQDSPSSFCSVGAEE